MLKNTDLRIGNLVLKDGELHVVEWLDLGHSETFLKPISITLEILEKLGFKNVMGVWYKKGFQLISDGDRGLVPATLATILNGQHNIISYKVIAYVHQLQNLYFALAAEELLPPSHKK